MRTRADLTLMVVTALFVGGLAIVAGAISFAHMRELATHHSQLGWKSYAFPVSVDGLEIVASLYLVAQRRAGRHTGWIPWVTLVVGTGASLAANVAVGGADPIGKALAGWPALSMLVSVKLLFSMFDHEGVDQRTTARDDQRPSPAVPDNIDTVPRTGHDELVPSGNAVTERTSDPAPSVTGPAERSSEPASGRPGAPGEALTGNRAAAPLDIRTVAHLISAARAARATLADAGRSLSRDNLADAMRDDGHGVSNARASLLLKILKAELDVIPISSPSGQPHSEEVDPLSEVVA
jgi:Protein of unknown function (DUF2637)